MDRAASPRPPRLRLLLLGASLVAAAVGAGPASAAIPSRLPPVATVVAELVGRPFPVACGQTPSGTSGITYFVDGAPSRIVISWTACELYAQPLDSPVGPSAAAWGLLTVIHESEHVALSSRDEARVECAAVRLFDPTARAILLGDGGSLDPRGLARVDAIVATMDQAAHAFDASQPAAYHEPGCN